MTRIAIAIDCEFNSFGGQLLSLALVSEYGGEWYEVLAPTENIDPWVAEHVMPFLEKEPISYDAFRGSLKLWLGRQEDPVIVADWYTDLMHLFQCFAGDSHEASFHIPLKAELLEDREWLSSDVPHNALHDARAIMKTLLVADALKPVEIPEKSVVLDIDALWLRDQLAMTALAGFGARIDVGSVLTSPQGMKARAEWAYRQADAMLEARQGK